ncbi:hypothetical protein KVV02_001492 [Mortierella alpina]|uniref:RING-type domain-containing protein n=1 Tax=Mortierella alpina TaxID=64518 RepID=A0A9P8ABF8_MORAP|nr:hypothetical protein KVV02_001492 [Mortierella alpina]
MSHQRTVPTLRTEAQDCERCGSTFRAKKKNCHNCGFMVCEECSTFKTKLPQFGYNKPVRCCGYCSHFLRVYKLDDASLSKLNIKTLKRYLKAYNISTLGMVEKPELIKAIQENRPLPEESEVYFRKHMPDTVEKSEFFKEEFPQTPGGSNPSSEDRFFDLDRFFAKFRNDSSSSMFKSKTQHSAASSSSSSSRPQKHHQAHQDPKQQQRKQQQQQQQQQQQSKPHTQPSAGLYTSYPKMPTPPKPAEAKPFPPEYGRPLGQGSAAGSTSTPQTPPYTPPTGTSNMFVPPFVPYQQHPQRPHYQPHPQSSQHPQHPQFPQNQKQQQYQQQPHYPPCPQGSGPWPTDGTGFSPQFPSSFSHSQHYQGLPHHQHPSGAPGIPGSPPFSIPQPSFQFNHFHQSQQFRHQQFYQHHTFPHHSHPQHATQYSHSRQEPQPLPSSHNYDAHFSGYSSSSYRPSTSYAAGPIPLASTERPTVLSPTEPSQSTPTSAPQAKTERQPESSPHFTSTFGSSSEPTPQSQTRPQTSPTPSPPLPARDTSQPSRGPRTPQDRNDYSEFYSSAPPPDPQPTPQRPRQPTRAPQTSHSTESLSLEDIMLEGVDLSTLSIKVIKALLDTNCVSYIGVLEKADLVSRLQNLIENAKVEQERVRKEEENESNTQHQSSSSSTAVPPPEPSSSSSSSEKQGGAGGAGCNEDDNLCKICFEASLNCVMLNCNHMSTCMDCGKSIMEGARKCPICREYVVKLLHVFRA